MKIAVTSLGCNKNLVDTEVMLARLQDAGCEVVDEPELADCLLINTCSFLTEAVEESLDRIVELAALKGPDGPRRLVVTGCMVARYGEELLREVPEIDALVLPTELDRVVEAVTGSDLDLDQDLDQEQESNQRPGPGLGPGPGLDLSFPARVLSFPPHRAYLKIGEGCSNRCSYCLIPSIRGEFASRSAPSLAAEMEHLVGLGVKEITMVAQDSGRYGSDLGGPDLPGLVRSLLEVPGEYWLRVLYVHPARVSDALLAVMTSDQRICPYLDIPFQHSSPKILDMMGRGGAPEPMDVVQRVRSAIPGVFLRTTVMTGFPGETDEDFDRLLEFIREARMDHVGVFAYSREEGTPAAGMVDQVPAEVAAARAERLMEEQAQVSSELLHRKVGKTMSVMSEGFDEKGPFGRHQGQAPEVDGVVRLDEEVAPGEFVKVKIVGSGVYDLKGEVRESDPRS